MNLGPGNRRKVGPPSQQKLSQRNLLGSGILKGLGPHGGRGSELDQASVDDSNQLAEYRGGVKAHRSTCCQAWSPHV